MIKVMLNNNLNKSTAMIDENTTLRQALEQNRIDYTHGVVSLDCSPLRAGDLDKTFADFGIVEKCYLSVVVKADNAAAIKIIARDAILEADFTLENLKKVATKRPKSLIINDQDGDPIFAVGVAAKGAGSVNGSGISFAPVAAVNGKAMMTVKIPECIESTDKAKDWAVEQYCSAVSYLKQIEKNLPKAIEEIDKEIAEVKEIVTCA